MRCCAFYYATSPPIAAFLLRHRRPARAMRAVLDQIVRHIAARRR
jgi:hypothetical protein